MAALKASVERPNATRGEDGGTEAPAADTPARRRHHEGRGQAASQGSGEARAGQESRSCKEDRRREGTGEGQSSAGQEGGCAQNRVSTAD